MKKKSKILYRPRTYVLRSSDKIEFKFEQSANRRWDLFEDILELNLELKRFDPIDIPFDSDIVTKFRDLDNMIANEASNSTEREPLIYMEMEPIARYMSPANCYWELFCWHPELDQMTDFGYSYKVRLGREARQHAMPRWFVTTPATDPFLFHKNFNLRRDPVYVHKDQPFGKDSIETETHKRNLVLTPVGSRETAMMNSDDDTSTSFTLLDIEWLNLATYIVYAAWVQNSYKQSNPELPIRFIDWTWCGKWREIGENYTKLAHKVSCHDLTHDKPLTYCDTFILAGSIPDPGIVLAAGLELPPDPMANLSLPNHVHDLRSAGDETFIYNKVVNIQPSLMQMFHDSAGYNILLQTGLDAFPPIEDRKIWYSHSHIESVFMSVYAFMNHEIIHRYANDEGIIPRRNLRCISDEIKTKFGANALHTIKTILRYYRATSKCKSKLHKINTFCQL
jgi:hypothetical protein